MLTKATKTKHERRRQTGFAKRWGRAKPPKLPELMKPDGAGYMMPLYCAAQWIATRGGTEVINPLDEAIWREAYEDLRDRIASEDVKFAVERVEAREDLRAADFAFYAVDYPFSERPTRSNEVCLVLRLYLDEEYWQRGGGYRVEKGKRVLWRRLMVSKADIARWWPFVSINANATLTQADATLAASASLQPQPALAVTPLVTGGPGRPTSMHLVELEHRDRWQRDVAQTRVAHEARELAEWFRAKHPNAPPLTAKTIENKIRFAHRQRVAERSKTPRN